MHRHVADVRAYDVHAFGGFDLDGPHATLFLFHHLINTPSAISTAWWPSEVITRGSLLVSAMWVPEDGSQKAFVDIPTASKIAPTRGGYTLAPRPAKPLVGPPVGPLADVDLVALVGPRDAASSRARE